MLEVGLIDIQHMQAVIKGFFFPKIATFGAGMKMKIESLDAFKRSNFYSEFDYII